MKAGLFRSLSHACSLDEGGGNHNIFLRKIPLRVKHGNHTIHQSFA